MVPRHMASITEKSKMNHDTHSSHPRLFPLTDRDLARMARAIESAKQYMEKYGQGRRPRQLTSENYINSHPGLFINP